MNPQKKPDWAWRYATKLRIYGCIAACGVVSVSRSIARARLLFLFLSFLSFLSYKLTACLCVLFESLTFICPRSHC